MVEEVLAVWGGERGLESVIGLSDCLVACLVVLSGMMVLGVLWSRLCSRLSLSTYYWLGLLLQRESMMVEGLWGVKGACMVWRGASMKAGVRGIVPEHGPRLLLVDELGKVSGLEDLSVLSAGWSVKE